MSEHGSLEYHSTHKSPVTANTVVGSTAAVVGALGVAVSSTAPLAAAVITAGGALVAAGALYRKLAQERRENGHR